MQHRCNNGTPFIRLLQRTPASYSCKNLDHFISKNKLLIEHQYGFRKNRTTTRALMGMEGITKAVDDDEYSIGVYIDLQKAFDMIDHSKLLRTLEKYEIRGMAHSWLKNFE